jgi:hypothetical protein
MLLRWIFQKLDTTYRLDMSVSEQEQVAGAYECGNEPTGSIKCGEFLASQEGFCSMELAIQLIS